MRNLMIAGVVLSAVFVTTSAQAGPADDSRISAPSATTSAAVPRRIAEGVRAATAPIPGASVLGIAIDLQVFGDAPRLDVLRDFDLGLGAPVYGAPTHFELLAHLTPAPLRSTTPFRVITSGRSVGW